MRFRNKSLGMSQCLYILTDKMDPFTLSVYELIKSFAGFNNFDLSIRQIAAYRNMSYGKAQEAFKKLKDIGIIKVSKKTGHFHANEYEICDEYVAFQMDPKFDYNKQRKSILDAKHEEYKKNMK